MGLRALIVDDEPALVRALGRMLSLHDIAVVGATTGEEALRLLLDAEVDVIVSDVRMPRLDGPALLSTLRARGDARPVVFLTGHGDPQDPALLQLGAAAVVCKPAEGPELAKVIRRVCGWA